MRREDPKQNKTNHQNAGCLGLIKATKICKWVGGGRGGVGGGLASFHIHKNINKLGGKVINSHPLST